MKYSLDLDTNLDLTPLQEQYQGLFGNDIERNLPNNNITPIGSAFLISAKTYDWKQEYFEDLLKIKIETVRIFVTSPNSTLPIHRDCIANSNQLRPWAINVPLLNCDRGVNQWFSDEDNNFGNETFTPDGSAVVPGNHNLIVSEQSILNCTKIIKTDIYHNVNNTDNDRYRVVLSLRSDPNISWNQIKRMVLKNE